MLDLSSIDENLSESSTASSDFDQNPYIKMLEIFRTIENKKKGLVLISAGLAELIDQNTINALITIVQLLSGEEWTNVQLRRQLNSLVEQNLIIRSEDSMLGTEDVSFYALTLIGHIAICYLFLLHEPENFIIEKSHLEPIFVSQSISQLVMFLSRYIFDKQIVLNKLYQNMLKKGNLEKIKGRYVLDWPFSSLFGDKDGTTLQLYEELLLEFLNLKKGVTKNELQERLENTRLTSKLNKLAELNVLSPEPWGKEAVFNIGRRGLYLLVPFVLLIYSVCNVEEQIFSPKHFFKSFVDAAGEDILIRNAQEFMFKLLTGGMEV